MQIEATEIKTIREEIEKEIKQVLNKTILETNILSLSLDKSEENLVLEMPEE
jgi:hypothetical protein